MTYKEIAVLAEKRLDDVMQLSHHEAFEIGVIEYMGVLLDAVGAKVFYESDKEYDGITQEERARVVKKVRGYCDELAEDSFVENERCGPPACTLLLGMLRACDRWLEKEQRK